MLNRRFHMFFERNGKYSLTGREEDRFFELYITKKGMQSSQPLVSCGDAAASPFFYPIEILLNQFFAKHLQRYFFRRDMFLFPTKQKQQTIGVTVRFYRLCTYISYCRHVCSEKCR